MIMQILQESPLLKFSLFLSPSPAGCPGKLVLPHWIPVAPADESLWLVVVRRRRRGEEGGE